MGHLVVGWPIPIDRRRPVAATGVLNTFMGRANHSMDGEEAIGGIMGRAVRVVTRMVSTRIVRTDGEDGMEGDRECTPRGEEAISDARYWVKDWEMSAEAIAVGSMSFEIDKVSGEQRDIETSRGNLYLRQRRLYR